MPPFLYVLAVLSIVLLPMPLKDLTYDSHDLPGYESIQVSHGALAASLEELALELLLIVRGKGEVQVNEVSGSEGRGGTIRIGLGDQVRCEVDDEGREEQESARGEGSSY